MLKSVGILVILFAPRPLLSHPPPPQPTPFDNSTIIPFGSNVNPSYVDGKVSEKNSNKMSINATAMSESEIDMDITYLSGLPMDKLLKIKKQLEAITTQTDQVQSGSEVREGQWLRPIFEVDTDEGQIYASAASDSGFQPMQSQLNGQVQINYHNPTHDPHEFGYITPQPYTVDGIK